MRVPFHALAAIGVLAAAVPASALTVQPLSTTPAVSAVRALSSDPVARLAGAGESFRESVAGGSAGVSGLPVYFEPTQAGSQALEDRYAADPVGFMARVNADAPATTAEAASTEAKASPKGR